MADFCKQCSIETFGEDFKELANLGPEGELKPGEGWMTLCEGCGFIIVSQDGTCIEPECVKHGKALRNG